MLDIFICEDNNNHRLRIEKIISNIILIENLDMKITLSTPDPNDILNYKKNDNSLSLYFLDVDLKNSINGIQLADKIRDYDPRGFIVFITTHAEMSYLTFLYKVEAIDYIIKDDYQILSSKIKDCIMNVQKKYSNSNTSNQKVINIKNGDKIIHLELNKILFFETSPLIHRLNVYTENKCIQFYSKMKEIEEMLDERFCRCHQSYIINTDKISEIDTTSRTITMINGSTCKASVRGIKLLSKH